MALSSNNGGKAPASSEQMAGRHRGNTPTSAKSRKSLRIINASKREGHGIYSESKIRNYLALEADDAIAAKAIDTMLIMAGRHGVGQALYKSATLKTKN